MKKMQVSNFEKREIIPDDIIAAMFYYVGETTPLQYSPGLIHEAIAELSEKHSILKPFVFSRKGILPFSPLLSKVFARLQLSRIISLENPDYGEFKVGEKAKSYIESRILPLFSSFQTQELMEIAKKFTNKISVSSRVASN